MNAFPLLAAFTLCVSFAVLSATFDDLREAPRALDRGTVPLRRIIAHAPMPGSIDAANEGLLDRELASADPVHAWLGRYLTPPAQ